MASLNFSSEVSLHVVLSANQDNLLDNLQNLNNKKVHKQICSYQTGHLSLRSYYIKKTWVTLIYMILALPQHFTLVVVMSNINLCCTV